MTNEFSVERVLRTLVTFGVRIPVKRAVQLADELAGMHADRTIAVENNSYDRGYEAGKVSAQSLPTHWDLQELKRLRNDMQRVISAAEAQVEEVVSMTGRDKKIQCIKVLRNRTGLGLKQTKDIVDNHIASLDSHPTPWGNSPF